MKRRFIFFLLGLFLLVSCGDSWVEKPKGLIPQKKMVNILYDMHVADAIFQNKGNDKPLEKLKSEDFYYSVLKKYNIADTVFEKSMIYYSNFPKDFEKIYSAVLDRANQAQEELKLQEKKPVDIGKK
jgi:hypothetical protein